MIRISEITALDILDEKVIDLNLNKLHVYESSFNSQTNKQIIMDDVYSVPTAKRQFSICPFYDNVLLGTQSFYPEQGLMIDNYHQNSTLQKLLNVATVPFLEFKKARLYFAQGYLSNLNNIGHHLKIYVKLSDGSIVNLTSFIDLSGSSSNVIATAPKYFESTIYNECIEFEFLDIDFLLNSNVPEIMEIRNLILGDNKPFTYYIEYGALTELGLDEFSLNGYNFEKASFSQINQQHLTIGDTSDGLFSSVKVDDSGFFLNSKLYHDKYEINAFMNGLKNDNEVYEVQHIFTVESYNNSQLIGSDVTIILSYDFNNIRFSPILPINCEYAKINQTIRVRNINTSLVFRRESTVLITTEIASNFKPQSNITLNLQSTTVEKTINKTVNKIVASSETPKVVQIEKKIYIQSQPLEEITIFDGISVVELTLPESINAFSTLFLKIGSVVIENQIKGRAVFEIGSNAYGENTNRYLILDESLRTISSGKLIKG